MFLYVDNCKCKCPLVSFINSHILYFQKDTFPNGKDCKTYDIPTLFFAGFQPDI